MVNGHGLTASTTDGTDSTDIETATTTARTQRSTKGTKASERIRLPRFLLPRRGSVFMRLGFRACPEIMQQAFGFLLSRTTPRSSFATKHEQAARLQVRVPSARLYGIPSCRLSNLSPLGSTTNGERLFQQPQCLLFPGPDRDAGQTAKPCFSGFDTATPL